MIKEINYKANGNRRIEIKGKEDNVEEENIMELDRT